MSQIERGEVSTMEAIGRYVQALGGEIQVSAVFGDDMYILRGAGHDAARPLNHTPSQPTDLLG